MCGILEAIPRIQHDASTSPNEAMMSHYDEVTKPIEQHATQKESVGLVAYHINTYSQLITLIRDRSR